MLKSLDEWIFISVLQLHFIIFHKLEEAQNKTKLNKRLNCISRFHIQQVYYKNFLHYTPKTNVNKRTYISEKSLQTFRQLIEIAARNELCLRLVQTVTCQLQDLVMDKADCSVWLQKEAFHQLTAFEELRQPLFHLCYSLWETHQS